MRSLSQMIKSIIPIRGTIILICLTVLPVLAQSPHGDDFEIDCSECHETSDWSVKPGAPQFDHSTTNFPLVGQHQLVSCRSCHATLKFSALKSDCNTCHTDIHKGTVGKDCARCHTPDSWMVKDINGLHQDGRFPLLGKHRSADCVQCHTGYVNLNFEPLDVDCFSCHAADYNSTINPNHALAGFSTDCNECHSINALDWATLEVDHSFFPLTGGHNIPDCFACHNQGEGFTGLSPECDACHHDNYLATTNPNHSQNNFPLDCSQCHTIMGWSPATFDHNLTQFPLTGKHVTVECSQCHTSGYSNTPMECYACHQSDYDGTNDPNHIQAGFSTDCTECHTTAGWDDANFDHSQTQFPLTGRHIGVDCSTCHQSGYSGTPMDCYACHQSDYENANDPNHVAQGYPQDCTQCHTTAGWDGANFDHSQTAFPLTGAHMTAQCVSCHESGYQGTPTECFSCHSDEFNNTTDPNHQTSGFPTTCDDCHTTSAWTPATFDHSFYPTGSHHTNVNCNECHSQSNYEAQCLSCHQEDFNNGHNPGDPTDCWACHSTSDWNSNFNHDNTNFPLTGAHVSITCQDCHSGGFQGTPNECFACHETNFNNTTNPNHQALAISTTCTDCHTTNPGWSPATYPQHSQVFELLGAHANITNCDDCHNGNYNTTPNTCTDCHSSEYNATTDPPHQTLNFPQDCLECHNMNGWTPANFDHSFYPTGSHHTNVNCNECHSQSNYDPQCLSCHQDDFNQGHSPGDPTDCWACHTTSDWGNASFDHNNTNFPLTGAHVTLNCLDCHANGYGGTPTECFGCHETMYNNTNNPDHEALQISTNCNDCHSTNPGWSPAQFPQHGNYFELLGAHASINNCDDCHNGDYNNTPNTCMGCHSSDYNGTTDPPHQTLNFSEDCLDCHSMNGWIPANFDHNFYPTGSHHTNVNCNQCHSELNYQPQCLSCHFDDFNNGHNSGDPTDCWDCHSTSNWGNGPMPNRLMDRRD